MSKKLTNTLHKKFVAEYLIDGNAKEAAIRAGYSPNTAAQQGYRLTQRADIQEAITEATAEYVKSCHITKDMVLLKWWQIANADYNELSSVRRVACGWCYGGALTEDDEYETPVADPSRDPDPDCIKCRGEGSPHVHIADTSKLSPAAKLVYQGAKETKFGIEVMTTDRMKALDNVARHLGMFKDTVNHVSEDGSMTPVSTLTPELAKAISKDLDDEY